MIPEQEDRVLEAVAALRWAQDRLNASQQHPFDSVHHASARTLIIGILRDMFAANGTPLPTAHERAEAVYALMLSEDESPRRAVARVRLGRY